MKRKITLCALLICCLAVAGFGTVAYFTADDTARNVITAGNIKIELKEMSIPVDGGKPVEFKDVTGVMPGGSVSKIVSVKNVGEKTAYIRVSVDKVIILAEGVSGEPDASLVYFNINKNDWTQIGDYYYYNKPLVSGAETEKLFERVFFDKSMSNMYQNSKSIITVNAQATQVDNNGDDVFSAKGWPKE